MEKVKDNKRKKKLEKQSNDKNLLSSIVPHPPYGIVYSCGYIAC